MTDLLCKESEHVERSKNIKDKLIYYESELKRMTDSVKACNITEMLDLTDFFIAESNTHMADIDKKIQNRIVYYTR